jgi:hypothetical protein
MFYEYIIGRKKMNCCRITFLAVYYKIKILCLAIFDKRFRLNGPDYDILGLCVGDCNLDNQTGPVNKVDQFKVTGVTMVILNQGVSKNWQRG